ncbi:hypothetical protein ACGFZK_11765 [Streptomyces sp. NPDC048257]|uniref:hypothetical protein n=1 Tax=Streptomyces sp. NPDC048257 TaxID=3365526 RepID=UPI0037159EC3
MFIRPMGVTVHAANRPAGHPLLRGLLARASGTTAHTAGAVEPDAPPAAARPRAPGPAEPERPEPVAAIPAIPAGARAEDVRAEDVRAAGPGPSAGLVVELTQLAGLAREGLLTPQEFTTAKARLLRG